MALQSRIRTGLAIGTVVTVLGSCGKDTVEPDPGDGGFPATLTELLGSAGLFPYEPQYPLWTNGSTKLRTVRVPGPGSVDTSNPTAWQYADGTMFVKTFAYQTANGQRNIETRVIRAKGGQFETAVYLWNDAQTEATLIVDDIRVSVLVTDDQGHTFDHLVPSRTDCLSCHGSAPSFILGFNELQLNAPITGGANAQLTELDNAGWFSTPLPATPAEIVGDADTRAVVGYIQGNCVHCHHPGGIFDLTYPNFFGKTVNVTGPSGATLIVPQDPSASALYSRFATGSMPPLGVQLLDEAARTMIEDWILNHNFSQPAVEADTP